jgi:hypothetical protein
MKIIVNESSESEYRGGLIFEAEIAHKGNENPKVSFWDNEDGSVTLNLHFWDSKEIVDGYTTEQAKELITVLTCAVKFIENDDAELSDIEGQLQLFNEGENNGQV